MKCEASAGHHADAAITRTNGRQRLPHSMHIGRDPPKLFCFCLLVVGRRPLSPAMLLVTLSQPLCRYQQTRHHRAVSMLCEYALRHDAVAVSSARNAYGMITCAWISTIPE